MFKKITSFLVPTPKEITTRYLMVLLTGSIVFTLFSIAISCLFYYVYMVNKNSTVGLINSTLIATFALLLMLTVSKKNNFLVQKLIQAINIKIIPSKRRVAEAYNLSYWIIVLNFSYTVGVIILASFYLIKLTDKEFSRHFLTIGLITTGFALFYFKLKQQLFYGICETAFAFAVVYYNADKGTNGFKNMSTVLTLVGAVYLVVRGLNNIYDGRKKIIDRRAKSVINNVTSETETTI